MSRPVICVPGSGGRPARRESGRGGMAAPPPGASARSDAEAGFTLLEILITVVILGMIIGTLSAAVILGFRSNTRAEVRTDRSNLVGFTSRLFNRDVASAVGAPVVNSGCGAPTPVVDIPLDGGTSAAYAVETATSPRRSVLVRRVCNGAAVVAEHEIGSTKWEMEATALCVTTGVAPDTVDCGRLELDVTWDGPDQYQFQLSAERRATAS